MTVMFKFKMKPRKYKYRVGNIIHPPTLIHYKHYITNPSETEWYYKGEEGVKIKIVGEKKDSAGRRYFVAEYEEKGRVVAEIFIPKDKCYV